MDTMEQLLAEDEESLSSYCMSELEKIAQLFSDEVQALRRQLSDARAELQELETDTGDRNSRREFYVSLLATSVDLQEALEAESETKQQLQAVTDEVDREAKSPATDVSVLEMRLKETEDLVTAHREKEEELLRETENLKKLLQASQAGLAQTASEHRRVEEALQSALPAQECPGRSEADLLLSAIREIRALNLLPGQKRRKQ